MLFDKLESDRKLEQVAIKAYEKGLSINDVVEITGLSCNKVKALTHSF